MRAYVMKKSSKTPELVTMPPAPVGVGEVAVSVRAVSIHPVDLETRSGSNAMLLPMKRPFVLGVDFVGEVVEVGEGVTDLEHGGLVYGYRGLAGMGAFAERVVARRGELARAPEGYGEVALATLPLPGLCALQAIDMAGLSPGARVLVQGGAGGVGSVAVQVFADAGFEVWATAHGRDAEWVRELGAHEVVDYTSQRFEGVVSGVDLVFDTVGGETLARSFAVLSSGGAVASLNAMPAAATLRDAGLTPPAPMAMLLPLLGWRLNRRAAKVGARLFAQVTVPSRHRLERLTEIAGRRRLQTRIGEVFGFDALPEAMDRAAAGAGGRVVVTR